MIDFYVFMGQKFFRHVSDPSNSPKIILFPILHPHPHPQHTLRTTDTPCAKYSFFRKFIILKYCRIIEEQTRLCRFKIDLYAYRFHVAVIILLLLCHCLINFGKVTFRLGVLLRTPVAVVRYDLQTEEKRQGVRNGEN